MKNSFLPIFSRLYDKIEIGLAEKAAIDRNVVIRILMPANKLIRILMPANKLIDKTAVADPTTSQCKPW
jgi:hypothetical protein